MNAEQIAKLKELAENASRGPWFTQTHCADNGEHSHIGLESQEGAELIGEEVMPCDADMRFIAAANPAAVLELIALAERTTSPVSQMTDEQIDHIARSYFADGVDQEKVKGAIHDALVDARMLRPEHCKTLEQIAGWLDSSTRIVQNGPDDYGPATEFDYQLGQAAAEISAILAATAPQAQDSEGEKA